MKFLKTTVALLGVVALLASPTYGQGQGQQQQQPAAAAPHGGPEHSTLGALFNTVKSILIGGAPPPLFLADPDGVIMNITDANYKETIFEDEWIIAFCSATSAPCADYFPTYVEAAVALKGETNTKFASSWVEENGRLVARFFIPARLPFLVYAKDGVFRQIPYVRNDTQFLIDFIEEEMYQQFNILDGPMGPYSILSTYFEKYADVMEWVGQYTSWMPRWLIYIIAGSMSGAVFSFFSGGSNYSSDPSKYPHLNPDGTLKKTEATDNSSSTSTSTSTSTTKTKSKSSSTKKRTTKKA
ncbi:hypothetical protein BG011_001940 [Mortierella polycephala]|uniref:Thioredoxin domain-containing protein n=1 Tax=Mortierella polycephala TaxID=41804 RepID=A0A9P6PJJ2_9FUNG|nr:hypothetical protein BG011_001940 [Mortierella polycephala]